MIDALLRRIERAERLLNQLDRRMNNMFREGVISDVDYASGTAVMKTAGVETAMAPWLTRAGEVRDWNPVTKGERAIFISPSGEPGRGLILPGGFSKNFPQNHDRGAETMRSIGNTSILQTGSKFVFSAGETSLTLEGGKATVVAPGGYLVNP